MAGGVLVGGIEEGYIRLAAKESNQRTGKGEEVRRHFRFPGLCI